MWALHSLSEDSSKEDLSLCIKRSTWLCMIVVYVLISCLCCLGEAGSAQLRKYLWFLREEEEVVWKTPTSAVYFKPERLYGEQGGRLKKPPNSVHKGAWRTHPHQAAAWRTKRLLFGKGGRNTTSLKAQHMENLL